MPEGGGASPGDDGDAFLASAATRIADAGEHNLSRVLRGVAAAIGSEVGVEAVQVVRFRREEGQMDVPIIWAKERRFARGFPPSMSVKALPWAARQMMAGRTILVNRERDIPPTALRERRRFRAMKLSGLAVIPLSVGGQFYGALTLYRLRPHPPWRDEDLRPALVVGKLIGQKLAEVEQRRLLRQREDDLDRAQAMAKMGSWIHEFPSQKATWSKGLFRIVGLRPRAGGLSTAARWRVVHFQDRAILKRLIRRAAADFRLHQAEMRMVRPSGEVRDTMVRCRAIRTRGQPGFRLVGHTRDITEQKQAEEALRQNEQMFRTVFRHANHAAAIYRFEKGGLVLREYNLAAHRITPAIEKWVGHRPEEFFRQRPALVQAIQEAFRGRTNVFRRIKHRLLATGRERIIDLSCHYMAPDLVLVVAADVTDNLKIQGRLLRKWDDERRRLGAGLHDVVGQRLGAIRYLVDTLEKRLRPVHPRHARSMAAVGRQVTRTWTELGAIVRGLAPMHIRDGGLREALEDLGRRLQEVYPVDISVQVRGCAERLGAATSAELFQIAQEAVTNALRHGCAQRVQIRLTCAGPQGMLVIENNGRPMRITGRQQGMGLRIMSYRADNLGGVLDLTPLPSGGLRVVCSFRCGQGRRRSVSDDRKC